MIEQRKKLIEVALPLKDINEASAREKSIRHGHPSTLHLWWARRPLAAARAVIFSQMVDDPSAYVDELRSDPKLKRKAEKTLKERRSIWEEARTKAEKAARAGLTVPEPGPEPALNDILAEQERERLFAIIRELVKWENTTNEKVLQPARDEIWQSWRRACAENADHPRAKELFDRNKLPAFHDPFAGGGALPLEAQRLGLESYASDLNPVAVLINKAMIEIPPKFGGRPPVNPEARVENKLIAKSWSGAQGLAEDVRYYGQWMRDEAEKRIGHLYPKIDVTSDMAKARPDLKPYVGKSLTVIAWLWARTVKSPNPAFSNVDVPLTSTFMLSTKPGQEAYVEPVIENGAYHFSVKVGKPRNAEQAKSGTKLSGANFTCLMSGIAIDAKYIRSEAQAGRMHERLLAVVAEGDRGRVWVAPDSRMEAVARSASPNWKPDLVVPKHCHDVDRLPMYGMPTWGDAFSNRQLVALATHADLVLEVRDRVKADAISAGLSGDKSALAPSGSGAATYADSVAIYLGLGVGRSANYWSLFTPWAGDFIVQTFGRNAIRMVWDHAEVNPFSASTGNWLGAVDWIVKVIGTSLSGGGVGNVAQADAQSQSISSSKIVSTDPPYYDNIGYAELSDFFYVWLRRALRPIHPGLFDTLAVPKSEELVAAPHRQGGKDSAETFFLTGMTQAMHRLSEQTHPAFPVTIYYAFKQSETEDEIGTASTGWETFLAAVIRAGFAISGTWPIRTERDQGLKTGTNVLASSIVLVCRTSVDGAAITTRREFAAALRSELPKALADLQRGNTAPVDLAQAAIGPGMAVYTRYAKILDAEGHALTVREALALINQTLDEALAEQEGDFDSDSRWALAWFEESGFADGEYGVAETLSKAKNTSVQGLVEAGILKSSRGKVRLLKPNELPDDWDPSKDPRLSAWEVVHHLVRALESGGEGAAADLVTRLGVRAETARELAYRLYALCERKKRADEAVAYNGLVQSWPEISRLAREGGQPQAQQGALFTEEKE
jgi:putative DNA methylase